MFKMNEEYFKEQLEKLLAIDSTTGFSDDVILDRCKIGGIILH